MQRNYKLILSYDGTRYGGWQIQPNSVTIQQLLQEKIAIILRKEVCIIGSGRTDAGVHALGQVAHFHFDSEINLFRLHGSLNGLLPPDIRVNSIETVPLKFHSQHSAIGKSYHYHLHLDKVQNPFQRLYRLHVREKISVEQLRKAAQYFLGTHDFTSFANESHKGTASYDSIRTVQRLDIIDQEGGVRLEIEADGFLYKMVRNIVGTLLEISSGLRSIDEIPTIFEAKDRQKAGKAAPPHGLFLYKVDYPAC
jgi:tRNA pseudouridine38-40 synthase